jgi:chemosensory pili system protein ChpA (sensor histidine kinase/response regulator)
MDTLTRESESTDLSALAWVHDELRRSLDVAHKALRRAVKDAETLAGGDVDAMDPAVLRSARTQLHQGVGALELVGLPAAAALLRASEAAVQRYVSKPHLLNSKVVDDVEHASFALLDYLSRILAGKPVSPLALFPQYRAVQEAAGADRVHPADLWAIDWTWRALPGDPQAKPRQPDAATRSLLEQYMLSMMRGQPATAFVRMSNLFAELAAGASQPQTATLWQLAAAVFEAQAKGLLKPDVFSKRMASRLLSQLRIIEQGGSEVSERLAQDLLFFCAQAASPGNAQQAPRLAAVRQAWGFSSGQSTVDYSTSALGRFDPALITHARKRVAAAKESWSAVAGGEMHRLAGLSEQFALVSDSLKRLFPDGELMAVELQQAATRAQQSATAPSAPLAMEVATSLLYLEAALEDVELDTPEQAQRVRRLAERIGSISRGAAPEPLETWMEDLYRRVSDRQTMGSVVQELRVSLSEVEKLIDQFFRDSSDRNVLIPVPNQLSSMRGVLSVLGLDQASAALLRMRDEVDGIISNVEGSPPVRETGVFDRLASNLGALGFLIDMLSVQPQMAKSLFVFDPAEGVLNPVMGRRERVATVHDTDTLAAVEPRLIEQAQMVALSAVREDVPLEELSVNLERLSHEAEVAEQPSLLATVSQAQDAITQAQDAQDITEAREQLSEALVDFVISSSDPVGLEPEPMPVPAPVQVTAAVEATVDLAEDAEMREIFLEEAREVLQEAKFALGDLSRAPSDLGLLTTLRRAYHTLKGSSRMVGLKEFGEAAWVCEQIYNGLLGEQSPADEKLLEFTNWSLGHLEEWVNDIAQRADAGRTSAAMSEAGRVLQGKEAPEHVRAEPPAPVPVSSTVEPEVAEVLDPATLPHLDLPDSVKELNLDLSLPAGPSANDFLDTPPNAGAVPAMTGDEFSDIDLISLDFSTPDLAPVEVMSDGSDSELGSFVDTGRDNGLLPEPVEAQAAAQPVAVDAATETGADLALEASAEDAESAEEPFTEDEQIKVIGPLRISIPLFNIFLNEADELSRKLTIEAAEWALELHRPIGESSIALAHSLAGCSATIGFTALSQLARSLEHAQTRSNAIGHGTEEEGRLFVDAAEEIRRLLHQFAAGFLKEPSAELIDRLAEHELSSARRLEAVSAATERSESAADGTDGAEPDGLQAIDIPVAEPVEVVARQAAPAEGVQEAAEQLVPYFDPLGLSELKPLSAPDPTDHRAHAVQQRTDDDFLNDDEIDDDIDAVDAVDAELFPIFEEEAQELLPTLSGQIRDWAHNPGDVTHGAACMRTLHTLKGGARLAGAMRLGEMAHRLESRIEQIMSQAAAEAGDIEVLEARSDALTHAFELLRRRDEQAYADAVASVERALDSDTAPPVEAVAVPELQALAQAEPEVQLSTDTTDSLDPSQASEPEPQPIPDAATDAPAAQGGPEIDWSRFTEDAGVVRAVAGKTGSASQSAVRVRAPLLDRLVNQAGEVSITRSRIESEVGQIRSSLVDLTDNLDRLRQQLRDIELQGETQMSSRLEAAKAADQSFDPLEFDRFTRFQELTRMMAESVNDVATVQRALTRTLDTAEDALAAQARLTRELQDDLLRTRMVEFEGLSDRLYRVVRQASKETGKQVRLDIVGGSIEVDRGVLDRMTGAFEHLLRNSVTHGIEAPEQRLAAGKDATGTIAVTLTQEGNEVGIEFRDDGAGLNLARIREKGVALGLLDPQLEHPDGELANLIFTPGFSTADKVTELAGRGIGMDVVRSEVNAIGGRIETATASGQGTSFKLQLPLTTAVTQVVMLRVGDATVAVPSTLVELVRRTKVEELDQAYATGVYHFGERALQFFWLGALLQLSPRSSEPEGRTRHVVIIRSAQQRIAVHVDDVLGNQEAVVKNLGPQLSRMPGLAGMTLLASGTVALIYNPVALATLYGESARAATQQSLASAQLPATPVLNAADSAVAAAPLVLVVDDSLTVRRVTQRLLVREGYRVTLAKDGLEALERLAEEKPQIVLSDIEMPRMDGFDLVRNIRGDARLRDLPVIMITSRIAQKHREYAAELGVDHYLGKPYSEEDLLALISRYTAIQATA